jgi:hypothetical protein
VTHDDETVERVARAIYEGGFPKGGRDYVAWENLDSEGFYALHDLAMKQARAALSALPPRELLAEALGALEPFAKEAAEWGVNGKPLPDDFPIEVREAGYPAVPAMFNLGHLRRARAAAEKIRAALEQDKGEPLP